MCIEFTSNTCIAECTSPADIAIMIDKSGSVGRENFQLVLKFAKDLIAQMAVSGITGMKQFFF